MPALGFSHLWRNLVGFVAAQLSLDYLADCLNECFLSFPHATVIFR